MVKQTRTAFIERLHFLLDNPLDPSSLRWTGPDAFEITNNDERAIYALSPSFDFRSLSSFIRQLSYYNFKRLSDRRRSTEKKVAAGYICFTHPSGLFLRGDADLLGGIVRKTRKRPTKVEQDDSRPPSSSSSSSEAPRSAVISPSISPWPIGDPRVQRQGQATPPEPQQDFPFGDPRRPVRNLEGNPSEFRKQALLHHSTSNSPLSLTLPRSGNSYDNTNTWNERVPAVAERPSLQRRVSDIGPTAASPLARIKLAEQPRRASVQPDIQYTSPAYPSTSNHVHHYQTYTPHPQARVQNSFSQLNDAPPHTTLPQYNTASPYHYPSSVVSMPTPPLSSYSSHSQDGLTSFPLSRHSRSQNPSDLRHPEPSPLRQYHQQQQPAEQSHQQHPQQNYYPQTPYEDDFDSERKRSELERAIADDHAREQQREKARREERQYRSVQEGAREPRPLLTYNHHSQNSQMQPNTVESSWHQSHPHPQPQPQLQLQANEGIQEHYRYPTTHQGYQQQHDQRGHT